MSTPDYYLPLSESTNTNGYRVASALTMFRTGMGFMSSGDILAEIYPCSWAFVQHLA